MPSLFLFFLIFSCLFFSQSPAFSSGIEYARVIDVKGRAEILHPLGRRWMPLSESALLRTNSKIRTKSGGSVQIAFDGALDSVARLGENSRLDILSAPPAKVSLERGELIVLREREEPYDIHTGELKILTKDAVIRVDSGGCIVDRSRKGTWVRVFGDKVEVSKVTKPAAGSGPTVIEEGFKFFTSAASAKASLERMNYRDYAGWRAWITKLYQMKDDFSADSIEKEFAP